MADKREFEIDGKALSTLRVVDLKQELDKRGLSKSGSKKELSDRLKVQLQLEKLHESASTDEGQVPNLKLQDEMVEQNDLIKDYLSQQQQIYAQQKENRRRVELEEQRTRDSEASAGDTSQEEEEVEHPVNVSAATEKVSMLPESVEQSRTASEGNDAVVVTKPASRRKQVVPVATEINDAAEPLKQPEVASPHSCTQSDVAETKLEEVGSGSSTIDKSSVKPDIRNTECATTQLPDIKGGGTPDPAPPDKESALDEAPGIRSQITDEGESGGRPKEQSETKQTNTKAVCVDDAVDAATLKETAPAQSPDDALSSKTEGNSSPDHEQQSKSTSVTPSAESDNDTTICSSNLDSNALKSAERSPKRRPRLRRLGSRPSDEAAKAKSGTGASVDKCDVEESKHAKVDSEVAERTKAVRSASDEQAAVQEGELPTVIDTKKMDLAADEGIKSTDAAYEEEHRAEGHEEDRDIVAGKEDQGDSPEKEDKRSLATKMGTKTGTHDDPAVAKAKEEPVDEPDASLSRASSGSRSSPVRSRHRSRQSSSRSSSSGSSGSSRSRGRGGPRGSQSNSSSESGSDASRSPSRSASPESRTNKATDNNSTMDVTDNDDSARNVLPKSKIEEVEGDNRRQGRAKVVAPHDHDDSSVPMEEVNLRQESNDSKKGLDEATVRVRDEPAKVSSRKISISSLKDKQIKKESGNEADNADQDPKPPPRKRRWGGGGGSLSSSAPGGKKITLSITTDSLKDLIPDVKPPSALIADISMDGQSEDDVEETESPSEVIADRSQSDLMKPTTPTDAVAAVIVAPKRESITPKHDPVTAVPKREPVIFRTVTQVVKDKAQPDGSDEAVPLPLGHQRIFGTRKLNDITTNMTRRSPSPARFPKTQYLQIKNLVRPFTLNQLKELLSKTGTLVEGQFWIDKIKSKCYVMYEQEEQAVVTRQSLHGVSWPSSNPKRLIVDFSTKEELEYHCQLTDAVDVKRTVDPRGNVVVKEEVVRGRVPVTGSNRAKLGAQDDLATGDQPERMRRDSRRGSEKDARAVKEPGKEPLRPSHEANRANERANLHKRVGAKERIAAAATAANEAGRKPPVREWDKDKIGEKSPGERTRASRNRNRLSLSRSRSRSHGRKSSPLLLNPGFGDPALGGRRGERDRSRLAGAREHRPDKRGERHREDEAPAKLLDDLFHKTKTTPCIYWLPLTVEQIKARDELKKKMQVDREKRRLLPPVSDKAKERNGGGSGSTATDQATKKSRDTDGNRNRRRSPSLTKSRGRKR